MKRKMILLCVCFCLSFCACGKTNTSSELETGEIEQETSQEVRQTQENTKIEESVQIQETTYTEETVQDVLPEDETTQVDESAKELDLEDYNIEEEAKKYIKKYNELCIDENVKRMAFIYLDEDSIPELLVLKNGEYKLYSYKDSEVKEITMPDMEIKAYAYGPRHDFESTKSMVFYWFEYVPFKGLVRVHGGDKGERQDYYLQCTEDSFILKLKSQSRDYCWYTYDEEQEIPNEEFLSKLAEWGYADLYPCAYLYEDIVTAYESIGKVSDTKQVLDDFVNGKIDALCHVEPINDIPEEGFVLKSYDVLFDEITSGEELWGSLEYIDFDNDGEDELIIHGYAGSCLFLDVIGDTVYLLLQTDGTSDVASVAEMNGQKVIERTDLTHGGRKYYEVMQYDSCGCLIQRFQVYAEYEGDTYTEDSLFEYNRKEISMQEFEAIVNSIH